MSNFLITSIIGSIVLTILINVLPLLFPKAADKAKRKLHETVSAQMEAAENANARGERARGRVFFPWKAMLIASIVLTIFVNVVGYFAGR
jgi:hypothetical protein